MLMKSPARGDLTMPARKNKHITQRNTVTCTFRKDKGPNLEINLNHVH